MRTIVTGIIVFILWSILCTWFYLAYIKGSATDETAVADQPVAEATPAETDSLSTTIEPEINLESPGTYAVHHEFDRSEIIPDEEFDNFIVRLKAFREQVPGIKLNVIGHTDYVGSESYNYNLGMRRAKNTKDYLVRMGVPGQIIAISSEGETSPVATNETDAGRAKNRRTEIHVIE
jgi:outer membrane protein OmpA-like peptidoglycan-associated protein